MFSSSFIGFTNQFNQVQRFDNVLEDSVHLDDLFLSSNSYMYDANETVISEIYSAENRIYIPFPEIPEYFIEAIISTEDRHFFRIKALTSVGLPELCL